MAGFKNTEARDARGRWTKDGRFTRPVPKAPRASVDHGVMFGPVQPRTHKLKVTAKKHALKAQALHQKHIQPKADWYYGTTVGKIHAAYSKDRLTRFVPKGSKRDLVARVAAGVGGITTAVGLPLVLAGFGVSPAIVAPVAVVATSAGVPGMFSAAMNLGDWGIEAAKRYMNPPPKPPPLKITQKVRAFKAQRAARRAAK